MSGKRPRSVQLPKALICDNGWRLTWTAARRRSISPFPQALRRGDRMMPRCMSPDVCRFSDAGMTKLSPGTGGRRPKSAKARNGHCGAATACPLSEVKRKTCARREYFAYA